MKKRITSAVTALFLVGVCGALPSMAAERLGLGDPMPSRTVEMQNVDGKMLTLEGVAGKQGTLVVFSCNHCPFVKAWQSRMVAIANKVATRGVGVMVVNSNDPKAFPTDNLEHMQQQAAEAGYAFPYVVDATSGVARSFGAARTPEVFLFDGKGMLVYHGAIDDNPYKPQKVKKHYLSDAVTALVAGEEIAEPETRSVGCSIKFRK
jgi:hypothetical protein